MLDDVVLLVVVYLVVDNVVDDVEEVVVTVVLLFCTSHVLLCSLLINILSLALATSIWSWYSLPVMGLFFLPLLNMLVSTDTGAPSLQMITTSS